jgi:hypothetical protein
MTASAGKFEADRKHQEYHAEFGQRMGGLIFCRQPQAMRTDHDADDQIAKHRRQVQHAECDHAEHSGAKQQQE